MAARKRRFNTKKERARRSKAAAGNARRRKMDTFPIYKMSAFVSGRRVAEDYRRYAKWQLKAARESERHANRLIAGQQDPRYAGRPPQPWETRRHSPSSRLVLRARAEARHHRENARRALVEARKALKEDKEDSELNRSHRDADGRYEGLKPRSIPGMSRDGRVEYWRTSRGTYTGSWASNRLTEAEKRYVSRYLRQQNRSLRRSIHRRKLADNPRTDRRRRLHSETRQYRERQHALTRGK